MKRKAPFLDEQLNQTVSPATSFSIRLTAGEKFKTFALYNTPLA